MPIETKTFQVRDTHTHVPVMATHFLVTMDDRELRRAGFAVGTRYTLLTNLANMKTEYDEFKWDGNRTMYNAHKYIDNNFTILTSGAVVDVEFILRETQVRKEPE